MDIERIGVGTVEAPSTGALGFDVRVTRDGFCYQGHDRES